jgi:hypothetical protein
MEQHLLIELATAVKAGFESSITQQKHEECVPYHTLARKKQL